MQDRRTEPRIMCADILDVCWQDSAGHHGHVTALLEDISGSGACLQLEVPVPAGAEVECGFPYRRFRGRVRYCEYRETGYFAGIEFAPGTRWTRAAYKPGHWLDPSRLTPAARR